MVLSDPGFGAKLVAKAEAAEHQFPTLIHHTMNFASKCGLSSIVKQSKAMVKRDRTVLSR